MLLRVVGDLLAILGGRPSFPDLLHVGRPNIGDRMRLQQRFDEILDRRWFTNHGPAVAEFEVALRDFLEVDHVSVPRCGGFSGHGPWCVQPLSSG